MSRQAGIKEFFPTDKAIGADSALATPAIPETPPILPTPPSLPPAPALLTTSVVAAASTLVTPAESATPSVPTPASSKRGASQVHQSEPDRKRTRTSESAGDDSATNTSTDGVAKLEPEFPNGPPTVWAMTRGDLCDSQHIFKSYQGGAHTRRNVVISLYIDKYTEPRDFLGRNKVITCA